jgi:hypothetical protein
MTDPKDANRFEETQRKIAARAMEFIRRKELNALFQMMKEANFTDDQRERLIALYRDYHGILPKKIALKKR